MNEQHGSTGRHEIWAIISRSIPIQRRGGVFFGGRYNEKLLQGSRSTRPAARAMLKSPVMFFFKKNICVRFGTIRRKIK